VELGRATAEPRKALAIGAEADERDGERASCAGFTPRAPPASG
jgi:hypothetical protein